MGFGKNRQYPDNSLLFQYFRLTRMKNSANRLMGIAAHLAMIGPLLHAHFNPAEGHF